MHKHHFPFLFILLVISLLLGACGANSNPTAQPDAPAATAVSEGEAPTSPLPQVELIPSGELLEKRLTGSVEKTQDNCADSDPSIYTVSESRTIAHTMEVGGGLTISKEGTLGGQLPGDLAKVEVSVGTAVNLTYGYSYGQQETLSEDISVTIPPGMRKTFTLNYYDQWENGTLRITLGDKTYEYPYSFRRGFTIEKTGTREEICDVATPTEFTLYDSFDNAETLSSLWRINDEQGLCSFEVVESQLRYACINQSDQDHGASLHPAQQFTSSSTGIAMTVQIDQMGGPLQLTTRWQCADTGEERGYHLELATDFAAALEFFPQDDWRVEAIGPETAVFPNQPHLLTIQRTPESITFAVDDTPLPLNQAPDLPPCFTLADVGVSYWVLQGGNQITGFIDDVYIQNP